MCVHTLGSEEALGSSPGSGAGLEYSPERRPYPSFALIFKSGNEMSLHEIATVFKLFDTNKADNNAFSLFQVVGKVDIQRPLLDI